MLLGLFIILCLIRPVIGQSDEYYVIDIKGEIRYQHNHQKMKIKDVFSDTTVIEYISDDAVAFVLHPQKGQYKLKKTDSDNNKGKNKLTVRLLLTFLEKMNLRSVKVFENEFGKRYIYYSPLKLRIPNYSNDEYKYFISISGDGYKDSCELHKADNYLDVSLCKFSVKDTLHEFMAAIYMTNQNTIINQYHFKCLYVPEELITSQISPLVEKLIELGYKEEAIIEESEFLLMNLYNNAKINKEILSKTIEENFKIQK